MHFLQTILPFDSFEIETEQSPTQLAQQLASQVEPRKCYRFGSRNHKPFEGHFSPEGFKMTRIIHYRNSFLPVIRGRFYPTPLGTTIKITMSPHLFVLAFMGFWLWSVGSMGLLMLFSALFGSDVPWAIALVPLGMFCFGIALISGGFWFEAHKTKQTLVQMFGTW